MNLNELIESNKKLIYSVVYRFKCGDVEDLFQVGCIGLIKAFNNYNNSYETKFTTYAYPYIMGEIYQYINNNRSFKVNYKYAKLYQSIIKAKDYLTQRLSRVPTDLEISSFLEIDENVLNDIENLYRTESLDYNYERSSLYDIIESNNLDKEILIDLKDALKKLTPQEKELIARRYFYNMSQTRVAHEMNMNQVKISRNEKKILQKIRTYME